MKLHWFSPLLVLLLFSCSPKDDTAAVSTNEDYQEMESPPLAVETMKVSKDKLIPYLELSGSVEGVNEINLLSKTSGTIQEVYVRLGQEVKAGDPLVKVDDSLALLNLKAAREQAATARIDFDALNQSLNQGGTSRRDLSAARNRLAAAEAALKSAEQAYENCTIRSPIEGTVSSLDRSISPGNSLSAGLPVARIINHSSWVVESSLGERQVVLISQGTRAEVRVPSAGNTPEEGTITAIATGGDPSTGSFPLQVEWTSENPRILSGMTASVRIPTEGKESTLIIPASSVVQRERQDYVFVVKGGKAEAIAIERGDSLGNRLEVLSGLIGGEELIVSGLNSLAPERKVIATPVDRGEVLE